jgi:alkylation response protein AidB-like acyl-CoA dehydrogenase
MDLFHGEPMFAAVRQMTHALAEQEIRPIAARHDRDESMPWDLMKRARSFGMSQTAMLDARRMMGDEDGDKDAKDGAGERKPGRAARAAVVGSEELAWGCAGIALALGGSNLAAAPVARMGTEEQKQLFRTALKGEDEGGRIKVAAMALSEPQTGSDISSLATTARRDGTYWVLRGHKQWITNGQSASIYVVWAQTDASLGRGGVRGFIVERGTPGLVPGRKETKLGIRASETAQVHFEDCRVHEDLMLGADRQSEGLGATPRRCSTAPGRRSARRRSASRARPSSSRSSACAAGRCAARRCLATSTSRSRWPRWRWRSRRRGCWCTGRRGWPITGWRTSRSRRWPRRTPRARRRW